MKQDHRQGNTFHGNGLCRLQEMSHLGRHSAGTVVVLPGTSRQTGEGRPPGACVTDSPRLLRPVQPAAVPVATNLMEVDTQDSYSRRTAEWSSLNRQLVRGKTSRDTSPPDGTTQEVMGARAPIAVTAGNVAGAMTPAQHGTFTATTVAVEVISAMFAEACAELTLIGAGAKKLNKFYQISMTMKQSS